MSNAEQQVISPIGPNKILDHGFDKILSEPTMPGFPETVLFDRQSFIDMNRKLIIYAKIASICTVGFSMIHQLKGLMTY